MLTGQRPYQDTTPAKVMMKHIIDPVPDIRKVNPSLPVGVDVVIAKTMAKTPDERYATASELTDTLDAIARPAVPPMSYPTAAPLEEPEVEIPPSPTVIDESNDATVLAEEVGLVAGEVVPVEQPLTEPGSQVQTSMAAMEEADETEVARPIFPTKSPAASAPKEEKKRSLLVPVLIGGGLLIGLFVIVGVVLLISNLSGEEPAEPTPYSPARAGSEPATEPAQEVAAEQEESTPTPLPEVDTLEQANALMEQAWALYDAGNFDRALELVQQAIDLDPDYAYHYRERAMMFLWQGDPAPALADINRAIEREDNADYFYERGLIFRELGDSERAVSSYHQAIEMNHENADYFADLGIDLRYIGALDESLDALNHAVEMNPSNGYYHAQRSYTLREIGHPEGALEDALLAYEINPDDVDMLDQIAHIYAWELEDPESALPYFDMAIERDPNNSGRYTDRALIHRWLGNADEAMADHNRAIELDPESAWNYLERGISFKDLFEAYEEAIADFDTAEELDPSDPGPYDARAGIFEDSFGDYDRAIGEVSRAIELRPDEPWRYQWRARLHQNLGENEAALVDYERAAEMAEGDPWPFIDLGYFYFDVLGEPEKAFEAWNQAVETDPGNPEVYHARYLYFKFTLEDIDAAIADLNRCLMRAPDHPWCHWERAWLLDEKGDLDGALRDFEAYIEFVDADECPECVDEAFGYIENH
jgi:tetratricopeptide (TPR) repeat protein